MPTPVSTSELPSAAKHVQLSPRQFLKLRDKGGDRILVNASFPVAVGDQLTLLCQIGVEGLRSLSTEAVHAMSARVKHVKVTELSLLRPVDFAYLGYKNLGDLIMDSAPFSDEQIKLVKLEQFKRIRN